MHCDTCVYACVVRVLAGQVEDSWGSGCSDSISACWGAAKADHRDTQGHVGPTWGVLLISETYAPFYFEVYGEAKQPAH